MMNGGAATGLVYALAFVAWACSQRATEFWAFPVGLVELSLAAFLLPAARVDWRAPLSPKNWALLLFHIHVVVAPLLGICLGFERGTLPRLPSDQFMNLAMLLAAFAHACFAAGLQWRSTRPLPRPATSLSLGSERLLSACFVGLGLAGLALTFGSVGGYLHFVTTPEASVELEQAVTTVGSALGTFLRPFLPMSLVLIWSTRLRQAKRPGRYVWPTLLLLVALLPATASYNRGSMVGPLLAIMAAYSLHVRRVSARTVAVGGSVLLAAALTFGAYRNERRAPTHVRVAERSPLLQATNEFFQVYGEGPQLLGYLLEKTSNHELHLGSSLFASVVYPIPIVGKDFRDQSGVHFYNRLIYGTAGIVDQIIPASGELFINFHLPGVVLLFFVLGQLIQRLQARFESSRTAFSAFACFIVGTWVAFPIAGSVAVLSQILIYSLWPLYAYFGVRAALGALLRSSRPAMPVPMGAL